MLSEMILAANGFQLKAFYQSVGLVLRAACGTSGKSKQTEALPHFHGTFIQACQHTFFSCLSDNRSQGLKNKFYKSGIASVEVIMSQTL